MEEKLELRNDGSAKDEETLRNKHLTVVRDYLTEARSFWEIDG